MRKEGRRKGDLIGPEEGSNEERRRESRRDGNLNGLKEEGVRR